MGFEPTLGSQSTPESVFWIKLNTLPINRLRLTQSLLLQENSIYK